MILATIRCWALHGNINDAISYVLDVQHDGKKCEQKFYESTIGDAHCAGYNWKISDKRENSINKIVGFHFQQSFEPGSISKEEAYEISKRWIEEVTGGEYDYVLALHTDKKAIHSHIIINPINKKTGKQWQIFYKRDLPKFKAISDRICKENGLKILDGENCSYGKSYYEWMMENNGDSLKTVIAKTLDNLIQRVSSYDELKTYLQHLGYEVEDDINNIQETDEFIFTGDVKLVSKTFEEYSVVRMPYTNEYMHIRNEDMKWIKENKTFRTSFKNDQSIQIYYASDEHIKTIRAEDLNLFWEKKEKREHRKGLRIKIPGSKTFIRCGRIESNKEGEGYSLDDVIDRIENNGRLKCDPEIEEFITEDLSKAKRIEEREKFYDMANIKQKWKNTAYYRKSKKERFILWKTKQIQQRLNKIQEDRENVDDFINIDLLEKDLHDLNKEFKNINDEIRAQESILEDIQNQKMENRLDITQEEIEEFIKDNIVPLYKTKKELSEELRKLNERLKKARIKENEKKKVQER